MLDATSDVLKVHYKSMKCDVSFSRGGIITTFRWGGHFSKVTITNVLPPFYMVHSVYYTFIDLLHYPSMFFFAFLCICCLQCSNV